MNHPSSHLSTSNINIIFRLLTSGTGSDLTITCGDHTFRVHSPIMCARSDYFAVHRDASTRFQASDPHHVHLGQEDPALVDRMITFIYTSEYPNPTGEEIFGVLYDVDALALPVHAAMYALGDFYGVRSLKWVAKGKFKRLMRSWYPLVDNTMHSAKLRAFIQAIRVVYTTTPEHDRGLRDFVVELLPGLFRGLVEMEEFKGLVDEVTAFREEAFDRDVVYKIDIADYKIAGQCEWVREGLWPC
ncbi:hypothetical protein BDR22DRAFT_835671 [Usnea florida]